MSINKKVNVQRRPERVSELSDEEIQRRWRLLTPKFIKTMVFGVVAAPTLFLYNRLFHPNQTAVNILNVAFQVACGLAIMSAFLTAMSLIFGRMGPKNQQNR